MVKRHLATIHAAGALLCLALGLAGCADTTRVAQGPAEAAYVPDPNDPLGRWMPLIREASQRYDMPEKWIRAVMMRESNGRSTGSGGKVLTSSAGALGLMQVMPGTYELMRAQYGLGPDPSNPRDNIFAGTAYLREMYDLFGAPGFLAAYNCGPACYAQHLAGKQKLPRETRMYVAALTPVLRGSAPRDASQSAGASAIEVAVVPDDAPKPSDARPVPTPAPLPARRAEPAPVQLAALPEVPPPSRAVEPRRMEPREQARMDTPVLPAPVVVASAPVPAAKPVQVASLESPAGSTHRVSPQFTAQVAEALLPPQAAGRGERVVMRFVSQRADGCGSMAGRDRACVTLASGAGF